MQSDAGQMFAGVEGFGCMSGAGPLLFRDLSRGVPQAGETQPVPAATLPEVDLSRAMEAAREEGRQEIAATLQEEMERRVQHERANVSSALDAFVTEKRRYFAGLEKEVVRLALAIAERVLHRETAMDPTLLAGAARVVLEQVDQDSAATLLVAPGDAPQWRAAVVVIGRDIALCEESSLQRGECLLQTDAGSFELGMRSQLCEIERGFFEVLGRSAAVAA